LGGAGASRPGGADYRVAEPHVPDGGGRGDWAAHTFLRKRALPIRAAIAIVGLAAAALAAPVAAQPAVSGALGVGRLSSDSDADVVAVGTLRVGRESQRGPTLSLLGYVAATPPTGGQWFHVASVLAGVGTSQHQPRPWVLIGAGPALVPGSCRFVFSGLNARLADLTAPATRAGAFAEYCGHDLRAAATVSMGINVPLGRLLIGPELGAFATTGRRRFTALSAGLSIRRRVEQRPAQPGVAADGRPGFRSPSRGRTPGWPTTGGAAHRAVAPAAEP